MDVFRNDGHLSDGVLESLIHNGEALDELTRLEAAEPPGLLRPVPAAVYRPAGGDGAPDPSKLLSGPALAQDSLPCHPFADQPVRNGRSRCRAGVDAAVGQRRSPASGIGGQSIPSGDRQRGGRAYPADAPAVGRFHTGASE